ncbi:MAG: HEAT repeat domain-containing protein [Acidobacteria bacterium]|nr:HEAT repeat domain-containing protein [Acidobacteriota bacterium]
MFAKFLKPLKRTRGLLLAAWIACILPAANQSSVEHVYGHEGTGLSSEALADGRTPQLQNLVARLQEGDSYERQRAAIALGNLDDAAAVGPLIGALKDEDPFVRNFAARSLGDLGDGRAADALIRAMDDENLLVRRSAAEALGRIGDAEAVDALIEAAKDGNAIFRRSAIEALGRIGDAKAVEPLIEALRDEDMYIRNGAAYSLTRIGQPALPWLVGALRDWALGPRIPEILRELDWQPSSDEERVWVMVAERNRQALAENWDTARRVFMDSLKSGDNRDVQNAVFALIRIGRDETIGELVQVLQEKGTFAIAEVYLNCGNDILRDAARDWALKNGAGIEIGDSGLVIEWGGLASP